MTARTRHLLYTSAHTDVYHDVEDGWLYVDWKGGQTAETVKAGCEAMLDRLVGTGVSKVLNDNTNVVGTWSDAANWVAVDWLPRMWGAGLRAFAWVQSPSEPSRRSANRSVYDIGRETSVLLFNDVASAVVWLRTVNGRSGGAGGPPHAENRQFLPEDARSHTSRRPIR